ncbi:hypothetical protein VNO78_30547 [Psophocarpus tetragonolobus]|uniref:Uncharacterized protein n=1 Tax=Psophocarpus tetragonolobus TaxID=3891 RepID=A0AAN9RWT7_PSOTE
MALPWLVIISTLSSVPIVRMNQMAPKMESFWARMVWRFNYLRPRVYQMKPRIGCIVVCLALVLAVFVFARDLKAFACYIQFSDLIGKFCTCMPTPPPLTIIMTEDILNSIPENMMIGKLLIHSYTDCHKLPANGLLTVYVTHRLWIQEGW